MSIHTIARVLCRASRVAVTLCALLLATRSQGETAVSPPGFETREGNSLGMPPSPYPGNTSPSLPNGFRVQELHPADAFSTGPVTITSLAWRPDRSVSAPVALAWDLQLNLSTTPRDSLSKTFADNYGTNSEGNAGFTTVISRIVETQTDGVREGDTHGFDYVFDFDTPYLYDPADGNLLLDFMIPTNVREQPIWQDFHRSAGLDCKLGPASCATTATIDVNGVSPTQFTFVPDPLQAGDADMDCDVDQFDLVQVQVAAKYLTGESATWGEGDWNGAPGGSVADQIPPVGNGQFDQLDIIAALGAGKYLQGSYCAEAGPAALAIPEPSTCLLFALGLTGMLFGWRRKRSLLWRLSQRTFS